MILTSRVPLTSFLPITLFEVFITALSGAVDRINAFPYYCPGERRGNVFVATWLLRPRPRGAQA